MRAALVMCLGVLSAACGRLTPLDPADPTVTPTETQNTTPSDPNDAGPPHLLKEDAGTPQSTPDAGPVRTITLYPIVLAHGFAVAPNTPDATFDYITGALQDAGFTVFPDSAPAYDSVAVRGAALLATIEDVIAETGAPAVNVIAHSMGGLDTRYVASPGGLARGDLIATVTTIGTPHRGTAVADAVVAALPFGIAPILSAFTAAFNGLNLGDPNVQAALVDLSEAQAVIFNAQTPDDPRVYYQSWAGVGTITGSTDAAIIPACQGELYLPGVTKQLEPLLDALVPFVGHGTDGWPTDGVVAVESAVWDDFHGCIPVDHLNETGGAESGIFPDPDPSTGFDLTGFYLQIARGLAARGD